MSPVARKTAFAVLIGSLSIEGLLLLFTGWWLPDVTISLKLVGLCWVLVCATTAFIGRIPYVQILSVWLWLLVSIWHWSSTTEERSMSWFLYQHLFPLLVLTCSHLIVLLWNTNLKSKHYINAR